MGDLAERDSEILRLDGEDVARREIADRLGVTKNIVDNVIGAAKRAAAVRGEGRALTVLPAGMTILAAPTREGFAAAIGAAWRQSVEAVFEAGRLLAEAKAELDHGAFEAMVAEDLPFSTSTARRLMAIARDERLSDRAHVHVLPPSWGTLYELTKLDDATLEARFADGTIRPEMERRDIATIRKQTGRAVREELLGRVQRALPAKRYGVILADPEWRFEPRSRETGLDRAADNHYPTSDVAAIAARDVASIAADDCVLFLWATAPMLPQALEVMRAWGFSYRSQFTWVKTHGIDGALARGTGYWNRNCHEVLLVGAKGSVPAPAPGTQWDSAILAPVGAHSEKPERFLALIEDYFPTLPKIELNRRGPARPGWDAWGNEAKDSQAKAVDDAEAGPHDPAPEATVERSVQTADAEAASRHAGGRTPDTTSENGRDSRERPAPHSGPSPDIGLTSDATLSRAAGEGSAERAAEGEGIPAFLRRGHPDCVVRA